MWLLYYSIQQKSVRYYSPFNNNVWKNTNGDRNYLKEQKFVEFLLFRSRFSSSALTQPTNENKDWQIFISNLELTPTNTNPQFIYPTPENNIQVFLTKFNELNFINIQQLTKLLQDTTSLPHENELKHKKIYTNHYKLNKWMFQQTCVAPTLLSLTLQTKCQGPFYPVK